MLAHEVPIPKRKKSSFFRRFSRRTKDDASTASPPPKMPHVELASGKLQQHVAETAKGLHSPAFFKSRQSVASRISSRSEPPQFNTPCFELPASAPPKCRSCVELPTSYSPNYASCVELPASIPSKFHSPFELSTKHLKKYASSAELSVSASSKYPISVELPGDVPLSYRSFPESPRRIVPSAIPRHSFTGPSSIQPWNLLLSPSQTSALYFGFEPRSVTDKWFVYSEGPDRSGKLKVHFHRCQTGLKIAQLFVVVDMVGTGAARVVGIKWNVGKESNYMNEQEVKYMVRMICFQTLAVELGEEDLALSQHS